jgi:DNA-binding NarL/FixJ family response regulator
MFQKVLIVDDLGSINQGVNSVLEKLNVDFVETEQYCDTVYLKIKKALQDENPYELLITDLSFQPDHREEKYTSGEELVAALVSVQPNLKVIVYSVEDRIQKARTLINDYNINAYVCKGRNGLTELEHAINEVYNDQIYISTQIKQALNQNSDLEVSDYDIELLKFLAKGLSQDEISAELKKSSIKPNSLSSIEKKLNRIKDNFSANNTTHLVAIVKDLGLI